MNWSAGYSAYVGGGIVKYLPSDARREEDRGVVRIVPCVYAWTDASPE
jgi:hypothetical protein